MNEKPIKTGTTTVAVKCKDGVVTAADRRATAGSMVVEMDVQKVIQLSDNIVVTIAGTVSDIQLINKYMKSELKLNALRLGRPNTVKEAANLLGGILYSGLRTSGQIAHYLVSGFDAEGTHIFDVTPDGVVWEKQTYVTSGSGSIFIQGTLDNDYRSDMTMDEAIALVKKAMNVSHLRDSASGNGINIFTVTQNKIEKKEEIVVSTGLPQ